MKGGQMADISDFVPGGIRPTDHVHIRINDGTCSRCRREVGDDVPLMLWIGAGENMLIYCRTCCGRDEGSPISRWLTKSPKNIAPG